MYNLKGKISFVAWGMTLSAIALVIAVIMILMSTGIIGGYSYSTFRTLKTLATITMVLGIASNILNIVGSFIMMPELSKRRIPSTGAMLCGIGFSISFVLSLISSGNAFGGLPLTDINSGYGAGPALAIISLILSVGSIVLLMIGTGKLSEYLPGLRTAHNGYKTYLWCIGIMFVTILIGIATESYDFMIIAGIVGILCMIVIVIAYIMIICGWWGGVSSAGELDETADEELDIEPSSPTQQQQVSAAEQAQLQNSLRLLTDDQLNYIMANPSAYSPAYVAEATKMIMKRNAWERVKDLSEQQLLDILNAGTANASVEELDAASMVLYTRRSPLFMVQIDALSPAELKAITDNPGSYYEGYVAAARERLNG